MANFSNIFASVENFVNAFTNGTFGLYAITMTQPKMNKYPNGTLPSERKNATKNPYEGRVKTISYFQNLAVGINYYSVVKSECEREGIHFSDSEFSLAFPKEETYCDSDDKKIFTNEKSGQKYLRYYKNRKPTNTKYLTILDNEILEKGDARLDDILRYVAPKSTSKKQAGIGLTNIIDCRNVYLKNIVFLRQGEKAYINDAFGQIGEELIERLEKVFK